MARALQDVIGCMIREYKRKHAQFQGTGVSEGELCRLRKLYGSNPAAIAVLLTLSQLKLSQKSAAVRAGQSDFDDACCRRSSIAARGLQCKSN